MTRVWTGHQVHVLLLLAIKNVLFFIGMWQHVDKLSIAPFAQSILVFWRNITALPPGIEEAAFIFHVSRGNWSASFSAPILQYFATIDNVSVGQAYEIELSVGPRWFEAMSSASVKLRKLQNQLRAGSPPVLF